jgi:hypothetical protein
MSELVGKMRSWDLKLLCIWGLKQELETWNFNVIEISNDILRPEFVMYLKSQNKILRSEVVTYLRSQTRSWDLKLLWLKKVVGMLVMINLTCISWHLVEIIMIYWSNNYSTLLENDLWWKDLYLKAWVYGFWSSFSYDHNMFYCLCLSYLTSPFGVIFAGGLLLAGHHSTLCYVEVGSKTTRQWWHH